MKVKYEALDGKTFDTEKECYEYERSLHNVSDLVPELVMSCKYAPIKNYLNSLTNTEDVENKFENFIIRNKQDILNIINVLDSLGYLELCNAIEKESRIINAFPDVLCLVYKYDKNYIHKYYKFSFIYSSYDIIKKYMGKIDQAVCKKLDLKYPIDKIREVKLPLDNIQEFAQSSELK